MIGWMLTIVLEEGRDSRRGGRPLIARSSLPLRRFPRLLLSATAIETSITLLVLLLISSLVVTIAEEDDEEEEGMESAEKDSLLALRPPLPLPLAL